MNPHANVTIAPSDLIILREIADRLSPGLIEPIIAAATPVDLTAICIDQAGDLLYYHVAAPRHTPVEAIFDLVIEARAVEVFEGTATNFDIAELRQDVSLQMVFEGHIDPVIDYRGY